jgi:hypothetical protein
MQIASGRRCEAGDDWRRERQPGRGEVWTNHLSILM